MTDHLGSPWRFFCRSQPNFSNAGLTWEGKGKTQGVVEPIALPSWPSEADGRRWKEPIGRYLAIPCSIMPPTSSISLGHTVLFTVALTDGPDGRHPAWMFQVGRSRSFPSLAHAGRLHDVGRQTRSPCELPYTSPAGRSSLNLKSLLGQRVRSRLVGSYGVGSFCSTGRGAWQTGQGERPRVGESKEG